MPYILKQAALLTETLSRMSQLPPHRLAGHCANLDYWQVEMTRTLAGLAGYTARFKRLKQATNRFLEAHPVADPDNLPMSIHHLVHVLKPDTRTTKAATEAELQEAVCALREAATRFIDACQEAETLTEEQAQAWFRGFTL